MIKDSDEHNLLVREENGRNFQSQYSKHHTETCLSVLFNRVHVGRGTFSTAALLHQPTTRVFHAVISRLRILGFCFVVFFKAFLPSNNTK